MPKSPRPRSALVPTVVRISKERIAAPSFSPSICDTNFNLSLTARNSPSLRGEKKKTHRPTSWYFRKQTTAEWRDPRDIRLHTQRAVATAAAIPCSSHLLSSSALARKLPRSSVPRVTRNKATKWTDLPSLEGLSESFRCPTSFNDAVIGPPKSPAHHCHAQLSISLSKHEVTFYGSE